MALPERCPAWVRRILAIPRLLERAANLAAALLLCALVAALALNVAARAFDLSIVGAALVAGWAFSALAFATLPALLAHDEAGPRAIVAAAIAGFATATLAAGLVDAASRVGGVEPVLAIPRAWRYAAAAGFSGLALVAALRRPWSALGLALGVAVSTLPLAPQPPLIGAAVFAAALACRTPVALALVAGVAVSPGHLSEAALAQNLMRGLSPYVLLAIPLFILAAGLMLAGGIGERLVAASAWFAGRRRSALGEANVFASTFFGGVSGSSIADAALGARLLVPAMIAAGYPAARAAAITAASAVLPNVLPPSIALLLAAAATDQSVGALWVAGLGAGLVLAAMLWASVRFTPVGPPAPAATKPPTAPATTPERSATDRRGPPRTTPGASPAPLAEPPGAKVLWGLLPPVLIAVAVLGGLRLGVVTSVEAGLLAVGMALLFAIPAGMRPILAAVWDCALQSGRVALLIGAATPVGFVFATSGIDAAALLPDGPAVVQLLAASLIALLVGTVLDVGAAILLLLPVLVPAIGGDTIHTTLVVTVALLLGGLTPPVGILVLVVKDATQIGGVYRAVLPYLLALIAGLIALIAMPALTSGLAGLV
ncbi:TRAP transporter large permease subunit [Acuticoccus sp. I52.16.1]|uniref:TRAP transporter large permease subunit n=1 Tax=Acuticoccus sp. I52.16.1 TaxID=2928472 RepID=UPI001FCFBED5|nr:TRAP transporter large permease subunit [Acuticoccus sp. I52.16.1]UOM34656.1 TRAP transporter large permease subunit [Acuticoccus sp. I52.16.1]